MKITNTQELRAAVRTPYAWPGGYPVYIMLDDGEMLCRDCARSEYRQMSSALRDPDPRHNGWRPLYASILWETSDGPELCAHCRKTLEPAYPSEGGAS